MAVFQRTFFDSPHSIGGLASGATPVPSGPRHCAHAGGACPDATEPEPRIPSTITPESRRMGLLLLFHSFPYAAFLAMGFDLVTGVRDWQADRVEAIWRAGCVPTWEQL